MTVSFQCHVTRTLASLKILDSTMGSFSPVLVTKIKKIELSNHSLKVTSVSQVVGLQHKDFMYISLIFSLLFLLHFLYHTLNTQAYSFIQEMI